MRGLRITRDMSLKTGQWHWRDQLAASLPQSGFGLSFFFSFALALHADEARPRLKRFAGRHRRSTASHAHRRAFRRPPAKSMMRQRSQNQLSRALTGAGRKWPDKSASGEFACGGALKLPDGHFAVRRDLLGAGSVLLTRRLKKRRCRM
jgi:hypothetical protein